LKENFDRFNYAIYKEKEMADFRRLFTALALVALFVGLASAQGGVNGGGGTMACATTTTVTPTVRSEGFTELVGDVVLNCTGGTVVGFGSQIPQANITVFLNTQVTSRILNTSSSNASEALLLIDEPGSATVSGYGPSLPQIPCATPLSGCVQFAGNTGANIGVPSSTCTALSAACPVPAFTTGQNVFQGVVSGNSVTFFGVPILPPSTTGSRIYRITNIRANANGISGGGPTPGSITGSISISPSNAFTINQFTFTLAAVQQGLTTSLRNSTDTSGGGVVNFNQCSSTSFNTSGAAGIVRFTENFPTAFKTRTALVNGNTSTTSSFTGQNIPGQVYNSESGFTAPYVANGSTIAGLSDWGTRLKAVFTNIPSGVSIYVSTVNVVGLTTAAPTALGNPVAQQVISETVPDANGNLALTTPTNITSAGAVPYSQVTIVNGTGVAVWEVIQNNYTTNQNLDFGMYISYSASPQTNTPAAGPMSVNLSYAPTPTAAFAAASATDPTKVGIIPRFADTSSARTFAQINICQTVLLFPFVTTATGFETGLAIANTTQDPFGTNAQTGACTLNWYQAGTGGTNPAASTTPAIPGGTVYSTLASNATNAGANFTGYMFAVCNFQYAHGYAAITDVGARGIFTSYLALVVPTGTGTRTSSAESLSH
jgi:hypothetical protein